MKTKLSPRFWAALTLFSLFGQVAWVVENMYLNVFIYNIWNASARDISLMVSASAISATLTTILIGALSDHIGKRRLFISGGYILWGLSIFGFAFSMHITSAVLGISVVIALDCLMTFFGSSANDAAFNAWLTDSTDRTNRGAAEGINAMMPLVAILVVFGGFMFFDLKLPSSWNWIFLIIGSVVILVGVLGISLIREPKQREPMPGSYLGNVTYGFRLRTLRQHPALYASLLLFTVLNIAIQIFMPYLILYYEVALGMSNYVLIMAPAILLAAAATAFWGKVYDKRGFLSSAFPPLIALAGGFLLLFFFRQTALVFLGSLLMMCGNLCSMAVFGARIRDLTPEGKAGRLQGLRITAQVLLPGIIGPSIGSAVLAGAKQIQNNDGTTSFVPNENIFLAALVPTLLLLAVLVLLRLRKKPRTVALTTRFEAEASDAWANEYPRPSMKRSSYLPLSGEWSLKVKRRGQVRSLGSIRVPFPPESRLSGIGYTPKKKETLIYERSVELTPEFFTDTLMLHFGAVDQYCRVLLNGIPVGEHEGGYLPFSLDVTAAAKVGKNLLCVEVRDPIDHTRGWGKQRRRRGGMWYTPTSGIWQPVWMENLPKEHFRSLRITPTLSEVTIETVGGERTKTLCVQLPEGERCFSYEGDRFVLRIPSPILWTPEHPHLYRFTLSDGNDRIESYFALRTVEIATVDGTPRILLNKKPYFFHGLLDQGYFSDGIYLPASPEGYRYDVAKMKELGFHMLRKHIKIEPEVFYYTCDQKGMLVFQDMVNSGGYSFLIDTALPTLGWKRGIVHPASRRRRAAFLQDSIATQQLLYNHPSVVAYTIFNEGWGQFSGAEKLYDRLRETDPTRIYDTASGWFRPRKSDVRSEHVYFKRIQMKKDERPLFLSEFGGYSCAIPEHVFNLDKSYGYRTFETPEALEEALLRLYREELIPAIDAGLCGAVLTQVSDVEDEVNGLVTYDRRVCKVTTEAMQKLAQELQLRFAEAQRKQQ